MAIDTARTMVSTKAERHAVDAAATTGDISPAGLMQAVRASYGDMAYTGGGGDLGNLARIAQRFLKEPPDSGTAGRLSALEAMTRAGGTIGGIPDWGDSSGRRSGARSDRGWHCGSSSRCTRLSRKRGASEPAYQKWAQPWGGQFDRQSTDWRH
jgi:hypothetical protein